MDSGRWLRASEAAAVLGVSEKTIRRRAQRGDLPARQVSTGHGNAWEVWVAGVDSGPPATDTVGDHAGQAPGQGPDSSEALMEALRQLAVQRDQLIQLAGQVGYLQAQLQGAQDRLLALEAPKAAESAQDEQERPVPATVAVDDLQAPELRTESVRKPWWRFW